MTVMTSDSITVHGTATDAVGTRGADPGATRSATRAAIRGGTNGALHGTTNGVTATAIATGQSRAAGGTRAGPGGRPTALTAITTIRIMTTTTTAIFRC